MSLTCVPPPPAKTPLTVCFQTELAINANVAISELQRNVSDIHHIVVESAGCKSWSVIPTTNGSNVSYFISSVLGESPPPPPRACFGREDLIERVIDFAEHLTPVALIGAGGIGKTSIALTVLHHDRIKERFGANRRFIRCDQFPASRTHFLSWLSNVIGAGVDNPEDLTSLRPFLSSTEMILVLDNAESLLDPQGTGARDISTTVEELSQFETVCLIVTSRISTVPRHCKRPIIPALSMESARDIFYGICDNDGRSDIISNLLRRLDFHALSITLLATTASHNMWDCDRLAEEWNARRTQVLRTDYGESLAATIELSLASPMFCELGPDARNLLGVIAFFPQGINEKNLDWLFPTVSNGKYMFDKFCALSLTYRSNGFVSMLAPLRDHLRPTNPMSSPLIQTIKKCYFARLAVSIEPGEPGFEEARWITSEDVNVEHLLDAFTLIDPGSVGVWKACADFMRHIEWHKPRLVVLGPKIEGLSDDHPFKALCLFQLSSMFQMVGNSTEHKRLLVHSLKLWRAKGNDDWVARALGELSDANRILGLFKEGIEQAKESSEIYERLGDRLGQSCSLLFLAHLLHDDEQPDAAKEAVSRAIDLLPNEGEEFQASRCHHLLGNIYRSKGETGEAIKHLETALRIASPFNWPRELSNIHRSLAVSFFGESRFDDAHIHIEHAKLHAADDAYNLGCAMEEQAGFLYQEGRFDEAKSEVLRAVDAYEKIGATECAEWCRKLFRDIEEQTRKSGLPQVNRISTVSPWSYASSDACC